MRQTTLTASAPKTVGYMPEPLQDYTPLRDIQELSRALHNIFLKNPLDNRLTNSY